jgi:serine/threonine-protein kinase
MKRCSQCQRTFADDMEFCSQDGTRLTAIVPGAETQLAAGLSRRFKIVKRLGAGGMGTVYLAEQIGVGNRPVALKVLNRKLLDDPEFILRFQNEAGSTGRIHHPNVVTIYEAAQADDGTPYIAMEYLDGETLRDELTQKGALSLEESADILKQTAHGLNAAHKLGIIHRDLKPDNIFLTRGDGGELQVKVVDFGIAKLREAVTHTITGMVLGTPAYMSPEQAAGIRSDQLDLRSDEYSLAIVVYEMLTGSLPFHSDTPLGYLRKHMLEAPAPLRSIGNGLPVPPAVEAVVMRALTKDRMERFESVLNFADEFSRAVAAAPPPEPLRTTRVVEPGDWREPTLDSAKPTPPATPPVSIKSPAPQIHSSVPTPPPPPVKKPQPVLPTPEHGTIAPNRPRTEWPMVATPQSTASTSRPASNRFFKVGFWILGISNVVGLLERFVNMFVYRLHFGAYNFLGFVVGTIFDAAFIFIYCRLLARKRYAGLIWLALGLTVLGIFVAPLIMSEMRYRFDSSVIGFLYFLDAIAFSTGLLLGAVVSPFIRFVGIRSGLWLSVVILDSLAKIVFFILALLKYKTPRTDQIPSA